MPLKCEYVQWGRVKQICETKAEVIRFHFYENLSRSKLETGVPVRESFWVGAKGNGYGENLGPSVFTIPSTLKDLPLSPNQVHTPLQLLLKGHLLQEGFLDHTD